MDFTQQPQAIIFPVDLSLFLSLGFSSSFFGSSS